MSTIIQVKRVLSSRSIMKAAFVKSGLKIKVKVESFDLESKKRMTFQKEVEFKDKTILVEEKVQGVKPIYGWDSAPKVERYTKDTSEVEKEILANVPASAPKGGKGFRKLLKLAAILTLKLERIVKDLKALTCKTIDDMVNASWIIRLFKEQLDTEDKLSSILDRIGA